MIDPVARPLQSIPNVFNLIRDHDEIENCKAIDVQLSWEVTLYVVLQAYVGKGGVVVVVVGAIEYVPGVVNV
jgi:hypothetical protein